MVAAADRGDAGGCEVCSWLEFDVESGEITAAGGGESDGGAGSVALPPPAEVIARNAGRTVDLGGRLVLPGLQDSHIHLFMVAAS